MGIHSTTSEDERAILAGEKTPPSSSKRLFCIITLLVAALLIVTLAIAIPVALKKAKHNDAASNSVSGQANINAACNATYYPDTCNQTFSSNPGSDGANSRSLTKISVKSAQGGVLSTKSVVLALQGNSSNSNITDAVQVCFDVLASSFQQLDTALSTLNTSTNSLQLPFDDIKTWVSSAMAFHTTCVDTFEEVLGINATETQVLQSQATKSDQLLSNALAIINALGNYGDDVASWAQTIVNLPSDFNLTDLMHLPNLHLPFGGRKLLTSETDDLETNEVPSRVDHEQRRHLLATQNPSPYDVMVASDGTGRYKKIQDAVNNSPLTGSTTAKYYTIYLKAGTYNEQVKIPQKATNILLVGDGATKTVITGSLSVALTPHMTTYYSATLIVEGYGFVAKGITVQNTAGAAGHQAVAVRASADHVLFYQCNMDSWQDTLYAHTMRQFYRECNILGTVDFIFGNGAIAFQQCNIVAKKSTIFGQQNTYTAQGKTDRTQSTGLSFQNCSFDGTQDLKNDVNTYKTYLGRPWKTYSLCVIMRSTLGGVIDPAGWLPWNTTNFGLKTSYFAEYQNSGAGSNTAHRVSWSHQITKLADANVYQAGKFSQLASWAPAAKVPYTSSPMV